MKRPEADFEFAFIVLAGGIKNGEPSRLWEEVCKIGDGRFGRWAFRQTLNPLSLYCLAVEKIICKGAIEMAGLADDWT